MELIFVSYIADLVFGDPQWFPHPVRLMGRLISYLHRKLSGSAYKGIERFWGAITTISVVGISAISAYAIIKLAELIHPFAAKIAWVFLAYTTLATKDLAVHAKAVWKEVVKGNITEARQKLSLIVGRDTQELSEKGVILATIETVAENTTDGIIAPLFYLFLGGPVLAVMFKAVSTLDSMIGHKSEKYLHFGWCAARTDEVVNYLPARIAGMLISLAALVSGKDAKEAFRIMLKEGKNNSAVAEAAMAGALGVRLAGPCSYQGRVVEYPYLGEQKKPISSYLIKEAIVISVISSLLMLVIGIVVQQVVLRPVRL